MQHKFIISPQLHNFLPNTEYMGRWLMQDRFGNRAYINNRGSFRTGNIPGTGAGGDKIAPEAPRVLHQIN